MDIKKNETQPNTINDESKYSIIYNDPIDDLDWNNFAEKQLNDKDIDIGEEPITKKILVYNIESTQAVHGEIIKIAILQCNKDYKEFYSFDIHAIILKAQTEHTLYGIPIKNPFVGVLEWSKSVWSTIYEFEIPIELLNNHSSKSSK